MPSIASVFIDVLPSTAEIAPKIREAFRAVDSDAREAGRRWGREIEQGLGKAKIELEADTAKARAEIDAAARDRKATVEVDADTLGSSVERGIEQGGLSGIGALQPALLGVGGTMLAGIASALSGVAGLLPAGLLGAGGVIGTLAVGLDGVKDAWDATGKAAQSSGKDQVEQAKQVESAHRSLTDAVHEQATAQRDIAQAYQSAKNNLDDLNLSLEGGKISEAQAYNNVLKARQDLAKAQAEGLQARDPLAYNDAVLRVASSEQSWKESKQRNLETQEKFNDAQSKGIENSDAVVNAKERERKANESVTAAQEQLNTTQAKTSSAVQDAANAMAKLSPNAQAFVNTLQAMKPQLEAFKSTIQDALFANLGPQIQQLASTYLPVLQQFMTGMGTTINQAFGQLARFLEQPQTLAAMQQIFANIGQSFQIWTRALQPFSEAFLRVTQVGSTFLPQLAQMVVQVANAFNQWAQSGQLTQWIQTGMTALKQLGGIVGQLIPMFAQLAPIGTAALSGISQILTTLAPYIPSLASSFTNLLNAITPLVVEILNVLLPAFAQTASWLGKHPQLIRDVVVAFLAWKTISGVSTLLENLGKVSTFLRTGLPADAAAGAAGMTSALGPVAALVAGIYAATGGHPQNYVGNGPNSPKHAADTNDWGRVLFGNGWDPIKKALGMGDNNNGPWAGGGGGSFAGPSIPAPAVSNPLVPTGLTTGLSPGQTWTPGPGQQPLQWVVGKGWVPVAAPAAPPAVSAPAAPSSYTGGYPGDAALLASVPAGRYTQGQRGDLTQGLADCSSAVEDLVNLLQGRSTAGASMFTGNEAQWLTQHGFMPTNTPMPGTFQVGFNPEHTQATLPGGTNFNWGSDAAAAKRGIGGSGAWDPAFTQHYYLPVNGAAGVPVAGTPAIPPTPVTPNMPNLSGGPGGSETDPMYVALPASQIQQMQGGPGQQLGQDFLSGIGQVFGIGDLFKDPTQFGLFKIFKGIMGLNVKGGDGSSVSGSTPGGGGSLVGSFLQGIIPNVFGPVKSGSPQDAPGQFMPLLPGSSGGGGINFPQIATSGQPGAPGPGNQDNSLNVTVNGNVGRPQDLTQTLTGIQVPAVRQGVRPLPG